MPKRTGRTAAAGASMVKASRALDPTSVPPNVLGPSICKFTNTSPYIISIQVDVQ